MKRLFLKKATILLTCLLLLAVTPAAIAAVPSEGGIAEPQASSYLSAYSARIDNVGSGKIQIWFDVTATGMMDKIGAATIVLKESTNGTSFTTVKTFQAESYSGMLANNRVTYVSYVPYSGISGRYYKATVTVYAEKGDGCDSRLKTTSAVKAS